MLFVSSEEFEKRKKFISKPILYTSDRLFEHAYLDEHIAEYFTEAFYKCQDLSRKKKVYSPYLPIIQSSGTGKTRLLYEFGTKVPLFYVLCNGDSDKSPVSPFFTKFFVELESTKESKKGCRDSEMVNALAKVAEKHFIGAAIFTYSLVILEAKKRGNLSEAIEATSSYLFRFESVYTLKMSDYIDHITNLDQELERFHSVFSLEKAYKDVLNRGILIAFDEAHSFKKNPPSDELSLFIRAIIKGSRVLEHFNGVVSLCGTNSDLSSFVPAPEIDPSLSLYRSLDFFEPFIFYYEDTLTKSYISSFHERKAVSNAIKDRLCDGDYSFFLLGRPLWRSLIFEYLEFERDQLQSLINTAFTKLFKFDLEKIWLSSFMSLVSLKFRPPENISKLLVSYSMRTLVQVSDDRKYSRIFYPPETVLSIAAYQKIDSERQKMCGFLSHFMNNFLEPYSGNQGEIVGQLHLLDISYSLMQNDYSKGFLISNFINRLVGKNYNQSLASYFDIDLLEKTITNHWLHTLMETT